VGVYRSEVVTGSLVILADARVDDSDDSRLLYRYIPDDHLNG